jgi:hypothetical protein
MMVAMSVDHGTKRSTNRKGPLSHRAARCLLVARELAGEGGKVEGGQPALAKAMGVVELRVIRYAMVELEERGLARRIGRLDVIVGRGTNHSAVDEQPRVRVVDYDAVGRRMGTDEWRELRARIGGLKRAMNDAIRRREAAEAELERIGTNVYADRTAEAKLGANAEIAALLADLEHTARCTSKPACRRCIGIVERLGVDRSRYVKATEVAGALDKAAALRDAATELLAAQGAQGVGAAERRMVAKQRVARLLEAG